MNRYQPLSRRTAASFVAAAAVATIAVVGGTLALFDSAAGPWLPAEQAARVAHCDAERAAAQRQACVRAAVAAPAAATQVATAR